MNTQKDNEASWKCPRCFGTSKAVEVASHRLPNGITPKFLMRCPNCGAGKPFICEKLLAPWELREKREKQLKRALDNTESNK